MNKNQIIKYLLSEPKIIQRAPIYPIFVLVIGDTALHLRKYLTKTYTGFVIRFKEGFGDLCYIKSDFASVLRAVEKEIKKDPDFLKKFKKLYETQFKQSLGKYNKEKRGDAIMAFGLASDLLMYSVGVGHIIEPISIIGTHTLKDRIAKKIKDQKELNNALNVLTTPEQKSFSNEYDEALLKISSEKDKGRKLKLLEATIKRFYWIKNSYAGNRKLTKADVLEEIKSIKKPNKNYFRDLEKSKKKIIVKFKIDKETQELAQRLLFITSWQDERKLNTMKAVAELGDVVYRIAKEFNIPVKQLYFCMPEDVLEKRFLEKDFGKEISERKKGFVWFFNKGFKNNHAYLIGKNAEKIYKEFIFERKADTDILNGICASTGSAVGRASICTTLDDIKNFRQGDILIASMTRPEYLPAMKKAIAIVTDEGGITCHAAIVSRELGIPCVIGTKRATSVINKGDLIEVKADHGAVKVLEKSKKN